MHREGTIKGLGRRFRQAQPAHLAGLHLLGHCAHRLLDRHFWIDPMEIIELDRIDLQPLQARVYRRADIFGRSEEHTSELQSLMRISYAVFCLKKKNKLEVSVSINNHTENTMTHDNEQKSHAA